MRSAPRWWVLWCLLVLVGSVAQAGVLGRAELEALFPPPVLVGEKDSRLPVWPLFRGDTTAPALSGWAFETIDLEPVSGYGGKPTNLLVVMDREGRFLDVRLLSHAEPIFQSEQGTATLRAFASQYVGLTPQHDVQVLTPKARREVTETRATLHGVTAGTVSATAIDRSIMESAAQVAQARLDDPGARAAAPVARGANDRYQRTGWNGLAAAKLVQPMALNNRQVEAAFRGGAAAGRDTEGMIRPDGLAVDLWIAPVGLPQAGRNLLDAPGWAAVRHAREDGMPLLLVLDGGRYGLVGEGTATRSAALTLQQDGRVHGLQPWTYEHGLQLSGQRSGVSANSVPRFFRIAPAADGSAFDPARPMTLQLAVQRRSGDAAEAPVQAVFSQRFEIPDAAQYLPVRETPPWLKAWAQRSVDLAVLAAGLLVLTLALARQRWLTASARRLTRFRMLYLLFTLGFIGWWAQGQLSIVNLTALIEALWAGRSAEFLLFDPVSVVLWAYTGVTLLVWGRGSFCGWLCPFGALQELASRAAGALGVKQKHLHHRVDAVLKQLKYLVLAAIVGTAFVSAPWTERLVEIEPFKTSISLYFQREWIYVAWALATVLLGVFVQRGYCRYLCPLGAALAVLGKVRLFAWIPRRAQCGTPCQTCRHRCEYQAIAPSGKVDYAECFQCLDCVQIHQDEQRCLPLVQERKRRRVIPLQPVEAAA